MKINMQKWAEDIIQDKDVKKAQTGYCLPRTDCRPSVAD
ncbi:hypothetical protein Desor_1988 [Desulfosporosinus orientis DSM 765]|uniref:Uncharacterized protein n=1 Tax=Desulfosporosinus orientis (strain ATCC 19365 / DSM 765 / NCIMB 8382 / VKM B-1628 / Singapore I) TaxID=768706 RepID=G7WDB4_DESOD|nr:hypothetical protein Desor_1988 [Desulfosporosinus orientis DSM 765]